MNTCPHCGATLFMEWNAGQIVWRCPRRNDGQHPVIRVITTDTTGPATTTAKK